MIFSYIWNCIIKDTRCPYCGQGFSYHQWRERRKNPSDPGHVQCKSGS